MENGILDKFNHFTHNKKTEKRILFGLFIFFKDVKNVMKIEYDDKNQLIGGISKELHVNVEFIKTLLHKDKDIVMKELSSKEGHSFFIVYVDGLTDGFMVERTVIQPLLWYEGDWGEQVEKSCLSTIDFSKQEKMQDAMVELTSGNAVLFLEGVGHCISISSKKLPLRGVGEVEKENSMRGPRDCFDEGLRTSTALIRRRIRDTKLRVEQGKIGERSYTDYAILYLEDVAKDSLVQRVKKDLSSFEIDGILDGGMVEQLIEKKWYSPFPTLQSTQRPDKAASAIMEGRVVILFDNSPECLIAPATFNTFFQAADDYYSRFMVAGFARILRYIAAVLAIGFPGFYVAVSTFHNQVLPTDLVLKIAQSREMVPFPILIEVLMMEIAFELLREAGIRLPGQMGNTIGVVGGLIVGQTAVEAGLVSTIVVIVVALTAIASFAIPNEAFAQAFRLLKFLFILAAGVLGLYGYFLGFLLLAIHLSGFESFGVPYMMPAVSGKYEPKEDKKDFVMKYPIWDLRKRPVFARPKEKIRLRRKNK